MKRFRTRLISFLLAAFMLCMLTTPGFATSQNSLFTHIETVLPYYLLANGVDLTPDNFSISQAFPLILSDDDQKRIVLVFSGDDCIGWIITAPSDSQYTSSFVLSSVEEISSAYKTSSVIAFYTHDNALYLHTAHQSTIMSGFPSAERSNANYEECNLTTCNDFQSILLTKINVSHTALMARSAATVDLDVPIVENGRSPHTDEGLCWAACVAAIGAYRTNTEPFTAVQLYNFLCAENTSLLYPHPIGIPRFIQDGYKFYDIDINRYGGGLAFSDIKLFIDSDRPIHAGIKTSNDEYAHGIVICGYQYFPGGQLIKLMDPNELSNDTHYIWIYMSTNSTNFTYVTSLCTYNIWYEHYVETFY